MLMARAFRVCRSRRRPLWVFRATRALQGSLPGSPRAWAPCRRRPSPQPSRWGADPGPPAPRWQCSHPPATGVCLPRRCTQPVASACQKEAVMHLTEKQLTAPQTQTMAAMPCVPSATAAMRSTPRTAATLQQIRKRAVIQPTPRAAATLQQIRKRAAMQPIPRAAALPLRTLWGP